MFTNKTPLVSSVEGLSSKTRSPEIPLCDYRAVLLVVNGSQAEFALTSPSVRHLNEESMRSELHSSRHPLENTVWVGVMC